MEGDLIKINEWLLPVAWLYGIGVRIRNELFEMGILKSKSYDIPVISVGNITVGGSGKTPHVEYLIRLLQDYVPVTYCHVDTSARPKATNWPRPLYHE